MKRPGKNYSFTKAQKLKWPVWEAFGIGIWILRPQAKLNTTSCSRAQLARLWKASWGRVPDIDALLDELDREGW